MLEGGQVPQWMFQLQVGWDLESEVYFDRWRSLLNPWERRDWKRSVEPKIGNSLFLFDQICSSAKLNQLIHDIFAQRILLGQLEGVGGILGSEWPKLHLAALKVQLPLPPKRTTNWRFWERSKKKPTTAAGLISCVLGRVLIPGASTQQAVASYRGWQMNHKQQPQKNRSKGKFKKKLGGGLSVKF